MSIGNLKTDGGKGTNWPWQYRMLLGLDKIVNTISATASGTEFESDLVSITCAGPTPPAGTVLRLEVRVWDTVTGGFTDVSYYEPGSTTADPADYSGCTITYLESGDATEATLQAILAQNTQIETNTSPVAGVVPGLLRTAAAGTVAAGARSVSIANVGAGDGEVLGETLAAGETVTFDAGSLNNTLAEIAYNPTTGTTTFLIATLT
jgi:hypothetical protein